MIFSSPKEKSLKFELEGDRHCAKKKHKKALVSYRKALDLDDARAALYDKLIIALNETQDAWTEGDFADSVLWAMRRQELVDPAFKRVNARSTPEYREASALVRKLLTSKTRSEETELVETLRDYGEAAVYPLIDFLLTFKEIGEHQTKAKSAHAKKKDD
jgi:hypothetical protein